MIGGDVVESANVILEGMLIRESRVVTPRWLAHSLNSSLEMACKEMFRFWIDNEGLFLGLVVEVKGDLKTELAIRVITVDKPGEGQHLYALYPTGVFCNLEIVNVINAQVPTGPPCMVMSNYKDVPEKSFNKCSNASTSTIPEKRDLPQETLGGLSIEEDSKNKVLRTQSGVHKPIDTNDNSKDSIKPTATGLEFAGKNANFGKKSTKQGSILSFFKPKNT